MPKITKIGNSLGVIIPKDELEALGLEQGDDVLLEVKGSKLEVIPVVMRPKLRPALQKAVNRTVAKFGPALDELAK